MQRFAPQAQTRTRPLNDPVALIVRPLRRAGPSRSGTRRIRFRRVADRACHVTGSDGMSGVAAQVVPPVRLVSARWASPFAPGRDIAFARVEGDALAGVGIRSGDHVALARHEQVDVSLAMAELAAVVGADGTSALWTVRREGARLRCGLGNAASERLTERHARVAGVVVAVLRKAAVDAYPAPKRASGSNESP